MDGKTLIHIQRNNKDICILLREGEILSLENIVDVWVSDQSERSKREDSDEQEDGCVCEEIGNCHCVSCE